jgi:hypothetical protein
MSAGERPELDVAIDGDARPGDVLRPLATLLIHLSRRQRRPEAEGRSARLAEGPAAPAAPEPAGRAAWQLSPNPRGVL